MFKKHSSICYKYNGLAIEIYGGLHLKCHILPDGTYWWGAQPQRLVVYLQLQFLLINSLAPECPKEAAIFRSTQALSFSFKRSLALPRP